MAPQNLARQLMRRHLAHGDPSPGGEIAFAADQVLLTDVLGTLVMLELEAMGVERIKVGLAVQYVDHNLLEVDSLNAEEHRFLQSACKRFGIRYARAGTGISHPVHMHHFGKPGELLIGCDSHTCAAGAIGMLAIGMGGVDVALALAGEPVFVPTPAVMGVRLTGALQPWVSAKDVILELLRRHGVEGGSGRIIEFYGEGVRSLSVMDRHVIANMAAETGATTAIFPSDERTLQYLTEVGRKADYAPLQADLGATYDHDDELDLSTVEPMIALPSSPGHVVAVRHAPQTEIYQAYIGSSANPGYRDFAIVAAMVKGRTIHEQVSLDINPSSRLVLRQLVADGHVASLLAAGARLHQPGCNGCIGMGQAPARGRPSLRTVPRNFKGRSGAAEDAIYLCSPETAAASALTGEITDPRDLVLPRPRFAFSRASLITDEPPQVPYGAPEVELDRTENITPLPPFSPGQSAIAYEILLKLEDDVSTDAILPAGSEVMPHWTNLARAGDFVFRDVDPSYPLRARAALAAKAGHAIVGGANYGQGSSRENAALIPRSLGLGLVVAKSIARIHRQNLINFGVLPLTFVDPADHQGLAQGQIIEIDDAFGALRRSAVIHARIAPSGRTIALRADLTERQIALIEAGGAIARRQVPPQL